MYLNLSVVLKLCERPLSPNQNKKFRRKKALSILLTVTIIFFAAWAPLNIFTLLWMWYNWKVVEVRTRPRLLTIVTVNWCWKVQPLWCQRIYYWTSVATYTQIKDLWFLTSIHTVNSNTYLISLDIKYQGQISGVIRAIKWNYIILSTTV